MSYVSNATVLTCDYGHRECKNVFVPSVNKGRRELRILAGDAGWSCVKRTQWTDLCPEHAATLQAQREAL